MLDDRVKEKDDEKDGNFRLRGSSCGCRQIGGDAEQEEEKEEE